MALGPTAQAEFEKILEQMRRDNARLRSGSVRISIETEVFRYQGLFAGGPRLIFVIPSEGIQYVVFLPTGRIVADTGLVPIPPEDMGLYQGRA